MPSPRRTAWCFVNPAKGELLSGNAPPQDCAANFRKTLEPDGYVAYTRCVDVVACSPVDTPLQVAQELHQNNWLRTHIGYDRVGQSYHKGDLIPFRFVSYVGSPSSTPDNRASSNSAPTSAFPGMRQPTRSRHGAVLGMRYVLELQAEDGGFGGVIGKAKLDTRLPVRVHGVNPNWTCGIVDRAETSWLPLGVMVDLKLTPEQQSASTRYAAHAALDLSTDRDVWIGNVVLCDQPG